MLFQVPNVLAADELNQVRSHLEQAKFIDGKLTAGWYAKPVKRNQQVQASNSAGQTVKSLIIEALRRNTLFQTAVRPRRIHSLLLSRYDIGMEYGRHTDNALMGGDAFWRSDVSFTLFLSDPSEYEGGELVIESADNEQPYKLEAGSALAYPSTSLHRVNPVTKGIRLVAAGWVQSLVRDASDREMLFDLETVRRSTFAQHGKTPEFDLLSKSIANLLRKWVEP